MTVRPYFWRSALRQNCRSFQNLNIVAILAPLLKEMGVLKHDTLFRSPHKWREFCVQFMESDFDFISRLTAEEGIFFYEEEFLKANDQIYLCGQLILKWMIFYELFRIGR